MGCAELYHSLKGRGLRATRDLAAGCVVGLLVGAPVEEHALSLRAFMYRFDAVVSDPDAPGALDLGAVDIAFANDPAREETLALLVAGDFRRFAEEYALDAADGRISSRLVAPGVYEFFVVRGVAAGRALEYSYGAPYWLQLASVGALPGTRYNVAWNACWLLVRNPPWFVNAARVMVEQRGAELARILRVPLAHAVEAVSAGLELGMLPFWFGLAGVRLVCGGVQGVTYFGPAPAEPVPGGRVMVGTCYVDPNSVQGRNEQLASLIIMSRSLQCLLPPEVDSSVDPEWCEARELFRDEVILLMGSGDAPGESLADLAQSIARSLFTVEIDGLAAALRGNVRAVPGAESAV